MGEFLTKFAMQLLPEVGYVRFRDIMRDDLARDAIADDTTLVFVWDGQKLIDQVPWSCGSMTASMVSARTPGDGARRCTCPQGYARARTRRYGRLRRSFGGPWRRHRKDVLYGDAGVLIFTSNNTETSTAR
jgi:hypothetical protein